MSNERGITARTLRTALVAAGAFVVLYAVLLATIEPGAARTALRLTAMFATNAFAIWCYLERARARPGEAAGWRLFALGAACGIAGSAIVLVAEAAGVANLAPRAVSFVLVCVAGFIQARAMFLWPWHRSEQQHRGLHILGSVIFAASLALLLWMIRGFESGHVSLSSFSAVFQLAVINTAARTVLLGGAIMFLLSEDPRRVQGPLGMILAGVVIMVTAALGVASTTGAAPTGIALSAWFAFGQMVPLLFGLSAWIPAPLETATPSRRFPEPAAIALQYVPFVVTGVFLAQIDVHDRRELTISLAAFLTISLVVVVRQVVVFRAVQQANRALEERVTERTRKLEQVQAVLVRNERLNTLATLGAGLTHDLNNLHGVIGMSAEMMQHDVARGMPVHDEHLREITTAITRAGRLTKRLMSFARDEMGTAKPTLIDLCAAVGAQEELMRMLLPRTVSLTLALNAPRRYVLTPATLVEQVLVNLISNARDAMPDGGEIVVTVRLAEGAESALLLEVRDTGHGIPPEIQASIFETFFSTKADKGTGIGLASVRALMHDVGGTIGVESTPGEGATFLLTFPLHVDSARGRTSGAMRLVNDADERLPFAS